MNKDAFGKLGWGFFFIMIDFRLQGFDIFPDVIGYILFAIGLNALIEHSAYFKTASNINIVMIVVSLFQIYESPAQNDGISFTPTIALVSTVSLIVSLIVVYQMFMGIKDCAKNQEKSDIYDEAGRRWTQFLMLQLAALFAIVLIFIPPIAIIYILALIVAAIIITVKIMGFMKRCGDSLFDEI